MESSVQWRRGSVVAFTFLFGFVPTPAATNSTRLPVDAHVGQSRQTARHYVVGRDAASGKFKKWRGERAQICLMDECPGRSARATICEMRFLPESQVCERKPLRIRDLDRAKTSRGARDAR